GEAHAVARAVALAGERERGVAIGAARDLDAGVERAVGLERDGHPVRAQLAEVRRDREPIGPRRGGQPQEQERGPLHFPRRVAMTRRRRPAALASSITATTRPWWVASSACTITCVSGSRRAASSKRALSESTATSLPSTTSLPSVMTAIVR